MRTSAILRPTPPLLLAALAGLATLSAGQIQTQLSMAQGDEVLGNGNIISFAQLAVNNSGFVYADVVTTDIIAPNVIVLNGFMIMARGIAVATPENTVYKDNSGMTVNSTGYLGWVVNLTGVGRGKDQGVFWNTLILLQEGSEPQTMHINGVPFGAGTEFSSFSMVYLNDRNNILFTGQIDDPDMSGKEQCIGLVKTDGVGNVLPGDEGLTWLAIKGFPLPATGEGITGLANGRDFFAFNNNDEWLATLVSPTGALIVKTGQVVARSGDPVIPLPGRSALGFGNLAMNDFGEYVVLATLDGDKFDDLVVLENDLQDVFIQENDSFPAISPFRVSTFHAAPFKIADSGDVFWFAQTSDAAGQDEIYCRNYDIIVQEGVTLVNNLPISGLRIADNAFDISPSGRFWVGEVNTASGSEAILFADFGAAIPVYGCKGLNTGSLRKTKGDARIGQELTFELDAPTAVPGSTTSMWWSLGPARPNSPCGIRIASKWEILFDPSPTKVFARLNGPTYTAGPVEMKFSIPLDPAMVDAKVYGQGFLMINGAVEMTNGYSLEIGA